MKFFTSNCEDHPTCRNETQKMLLNESISDDEIMRAIVSDENSIPPCVYQQTSCRQSSLFLALDMCRESVVKKLLDIYESDMHAVTSQGFIGDSCAVLVAYGENDRDFVHEKFSQLTHLQRQAVDEDKHIIILCKSTNELVDDVKILSSPKTEEEKQVFLKIIARLYPNGTIDVNARTGCGENLLDVAAYHGLIWAIEKLIDFGSRQHESAFHYACINDQIETVKWLYRKFKIDLLKFMTQERTLFEIAKNGATEVFDFLINEVDKCDGAEFVQEIMQRKCEDSQRSILHIAAANSQFKFLMNALRYTNDYRSVDQLCHNVLHVLLSNSNPDRAIVKYLMEKHPELFTLEDFRQSTPLHLLALNNFLPEITELYQTYSFYKSSFFKNYADTPTTEKVNAKIWVESYGHRVLREIVKLNHLEMFDFIIENHEAIEFEDSMYISGLVGLAAERDNGMEMMVRLSKLKFFNVNFACEKGTFAIIAALKARKFENFHYLLGFTQHLNGVIETVSGLNLLGLAISGKDDHEMFGIFHDLVGKGVKIQHRGAKNETLLHIAVASDNMKIAKFLLDNGLKVEDVNKSNENTFHFVNSVEMFKLLLSSAGTKIPEVINQLSMEKSTPFGNFVMRFAADENPNREIIDEFVKLQADILCCGANPLHHISTVKWAEILLNHSNIEPNDVNEYGENCVHLALRNRHFDVARYILLNSEIDKLALTNVENSILHYLIYGDDYRKLFIRELKTLFDELLNKFINGKTIDGRLILTTLIEGGEMKALQHPNADFQQVDLRNNTVLHSSVMSEVPLTAIKMLIDCGVPVNAVNDQESTALMLSLDKNRIDVARHLMSLENVDVSRINIKGNTALHYAAQNDNVQAICKLLSMLKTNSSTCIIAHENKKSEKFYDLLGDFSKKLFVDFKCVK